MNRCARMNLIRNRHIPIWIPLPLYAIRNSEVEHVTIHGPSLAGTVDGIACESPVGHPGGSARLSDLGAHGGRRHGEFAGSGESARRACFADLFLLTRIAIVAASTSTTISAAPPHTA